MSEQATRKTQSRVSERERRRKQDKTRATLFKIIPVVIVAVLALAGASLILLGSNSSDGAGVIGPQWEVDRQQIELGDRKFNTTVRAAYNFKNTGDAALTLTVPRLVTAVEGC